MLFQPLVLLEGHAWVLLQLPTLQPTTLLEEWPKLHQAPPP